MPKSIKTKTKRSKWLLDKIKDGVLDPIVDLLPFGAQRRKRVPRRRAAMPNRGRPRRRRRQIKRRPGGGNWDNDSLPGNQRSADPSLANFATPASFARVENNTTFLGPERSITHPELGIAGVSVDFNQPLADGKVGWILQSIAPAQFVNSFFDTLSGPASTWPTLANPGAVVPGPYPCVGNFIDVNPSVSYLGGPLSTIASRYLKYRFNNLVITFTTAVGTQQSGSFAMCICDDPSAVSAVATSFNSAREVTPNLLAPYRIPEACLRWDSRDKQLYFIESPDYIGPGNPGTVPDARQTIQCSIAAFDSGILWFNGNTGGANAVIIPVGYFTISGNVEFYEPIPPTNVPGTKFERDAVERTLARIRGGVIAGVQRLPPVPTIRRRPCDPAMPVSAALIAEFYGPINSPTLDEGKSDSDEPSFVPLTPPPSSKKTSNKH
jgi:hypothetical protein